MSSIVVAWQGFVDDYNAFQSRKYSFQPPNLAKKRKPNNTNLIVLRPDPFFGIQVITESLTLEFGSRLNPNQFFDIEIFCESFNKTLHFSTKPCSLDYKMPKFSSQIMPFSTKPCNFFCKIMQIIDKSQIRILKKRFESIPNP